LKKNIKKNVSGFGDLKSILDILKMSFFQKLAQKRQKIFQKSGFPWRWSGFLINEKIFVMTSFFYIFYRKGLGSFFSISIGYNGYRNGYEK
jgi:hypothetical protein